VPIVAPPDSIRARELSWSGRDAGWNCGGRPVRRTADRGTVFLVQFPGVETLLQGASTCAISSFAANLSALAALSFPGTSSTLPPDREILMRREVIPRDPKRTFSFARVSTLAYVHPSPSDSGSSVIVIAAERGGRMRVGRAGGAPPS